MKAFCGRALLVALAMSAGALAYGQAVKFRNLTIAAEVPAGSLTLPASIGSSAVVVPCAQCPPKSYPVTANTEFFLGTTPVTMADLKAAIVGKPDLLVTMLYSADTNVVVSFTVEVPAPAPAPRRTR
jgi:hypothetical protein